ncbi:hypothetical protein [Paenibacillus sp. FSL H7-0756]
MTVQQSPQARGSGDCFFLLRVNRAQEALQTGEMQIGVDLS